MGPVSYSCIKSSNQKGKGKFKQEKKILESIFDSFKFVGEKHPILTSTLNKNNI